MEVKAWHSVGSAFLCSAVFGKLPEIELGQTHVCLPVSLVIDEVLTHTDEYLGSAFSYFNWVSDETIQTSIDIQPFIRKNDSHTSMSVGDILELVDLREFYIVEPVGFRKLELMK